MADVDTQPIEAVHLPQVGRFLNQHLNRRFSPEQWTQSLLHDWSAARPNHGMQLLDAGQLVGVLCAIYSDQIIDGRLEKFCNPHSWCVLDTHRQHSIRLVLQILKQPGYHFTMFTPNPKVTQVFRGLRFRDLDDRLLIIPNVPSPAAFAKGLFVETDRDRIPARLAPQVAADFKAHAGIPWLEFLAFGADGEACLIIYKRIRRKGLPCAWIMHVSDARAFQRYLPVLRTHLLARGIAALQIEARWLDATPRFALATRRTQPKLFLSKTLDQSRIRDVYSELVALDV